MKKGNIVKKKTFIKYFKPNQVVVLMEAHLLGIKATGLTFNEDPMTIRRSV